MKRTPLKRKTPLRSTWARSKHAKGHVTLPPMKPRAPLKKVSRAQRRKMDAYHTARIAFLRENPACGICLARGMTAAPATEVHHLRGRAGRLLCEVRFFVPSCRGCREWPHENPREARALGVLAEPWEWNVSPGNYRPPPRL